MLNPVFLETTARIVKRRGYLQISLTEHILIKCIFFIHLLPSSENLVAIHERTSAFTFVATLELVYNLKIEIQDIATILLCRNDQQTNDCLIIFTLYV